MCSSWMRGKSSSKLSDRFASLGSSGLFGSRVSSWAGCVGLLDDGGVGVWMKGNKSQARQEWGGGKEILKRLEETSMMTMIVRRVWPQKFQIRRYSPRVV